MLSALNFNVLTPCLFFSKLAGAPGTAVGVEFVLRPTFAPARALDAGPDARVASVPAQAHDRPLAHPSPHTRHPTDPPAPGFGVSFSDPRLLPVSVNIFASHVLGGLIGWLLVRAARTPPDLRAHLILCTAVGTATIWAEEQSFRTTLLV